MAFIAKMKGLNVRERRMWGGISFSVDLLFYFESTTSEHKLKLKLKQKMFESVGA